MEQTAAPMSLARVLSFGLGAGLWVTSFVLPAVATDPTARFPGVMCAIAALNPLLLGRPRGLFAIAGGLLNPMLLCYAAAWLARSRSLVRPLLALGVLLAVIASARYIRHSRMSAEYGFYAWAGGALLMIAGELRRSSQKRTSTY
jgi:hypothetical protein